MANATAEVTKSESIREAFKAMPDAKAKEIVSYLAEKGIEVTEGLVYQVKKVSKNKKPGRKPGRKPSVAVPQVSSVAASSNGVSAVKSNGVLSVGASITLVKEAAEKVGGWSSLKEIVDAMQ